MAIFSVTVDVTQIAKDYEAIQGALEMHLQNVADRIVRRLAEEVAQPIAQSEFGYGGSVIVTTEKTPTGYAIIAEGEAVCFLEFGAGVDTDTRHPFVGKVPFAVRPGSWSENHAKEFSTKGYWIFGGRKYTGVQARRGMYEAYKAVLQEINRIAREEFEK